MPYLAEKRDFRLIRQLPKGGESSRVVTSPGNIYPWESIREGEFLDQAFPLEPAIVRRIERSLRNRMSLYRLPVTIHKHPQGTPDHPFPHFLVGWSRGHTLQKGSIFTSERLLKKAQEKKKLEKESREKSGKK